MSENVWEGEFENDYKWSYAMKPAARPDKVYLHKAKILSLEEFTVSENDRLVGNIIMLRSLS